MLCIYYAHEPGVRPEKGRGERREARPHAQRRGGVLRDTLALTMEDERADGEQRFVTVGANVFGELRVVVWTGRGDDVRIISVRRPTPAERKAYEG
jgi:uncharacterized DUF497 family protein